MIIISVSEFCAVANSEKLRDRGLSIKLVNGVVRNTAAGFTRMLSQNTASFHGARVNVNLFKLTTNVRLLLHRLLEDIKIINTIPRKSVDLYPNLSINVQKYRHKLILKTQITQ